MHFLSHDLLQIAHQRRTTLLQEAAHARLIHLVHTSHYPRPPAPSLRAWAAGALHTLATWIDDRSAITIAAPGPRAAASV